MSIIKDYTIADYWNAFSSDCRTEIVEHTFKSKDTYKMLYLAAKKVADTYRDKALGLKSYNDLIQAQEELDLLDKSLTLLG